MILSPRNGERQPADSPRHRRLMRRTLLLSLALFVPLSLSSATAAEPIKLGEIEPLTGKEAAFGQQAHRGVLMAIAEINARGGVLGRPLAVVVEDNQSKSGDSATVAKKLLSRDKVVALLSGGTSSNCLEVAPLAEAARITLPAAKPARPRWRTWPVDRRDFHARWL